MADYASTWYVKTRLPCERGKYITQVKHRVRLLHGGHLGRLKVHHWNYFCIFYSFELKLCRMVELCIPKNRMFFCFSILTVLAGKCRHKIDVIETNVKKILKKLNCFRKYSILQCTYVSKNSNKMVGNSKIKA